MEYPLPGDFGVQDGLPPGTSVLFHGPALSGKQEAAFRTVAHGFEDGEAALVVCFDNSPDDVVSALAENSGLSASSLASRVGIVNASVNTVSLDGDFRVADIDSPADLTGVGIRIGKMFDELAEEYDRVRVMYDSVSTALMYRDGKTVYKFMRKTVGDCTSRGALVVALLDTGVPEENEKEQILGIFDGDIEFRSEGGTVEYRSERVPGMSRDWKTLWTVGEAVPASESTEVVNGGEGGGDRESSNVGVSVPDDLSSLHELAETVLNSRQTLTIFNQTDGMDLDSVKDYFDTFGVDVVTAEVDFGPVDFAVLHKGDEFLAAAHIAALGTAVDIETLDVETGTPDRQLGQVLLAHVDSSAFAARRVWKRFLIRTSRHIELRALRSGTGVLHVGFQTLSRFYDKHGTRRVYSEIVDAGVDVHLYGVPDIDDVGAINEGITVHPEDGEEIARTWFLVYDGGDDTATLISEEQESGSYRGFWSFDGTVAEAARRYIETAYPLKENV
ncbi:MAG: DICT sensory domain-containing protein [Halobacteriales archaeon]